jgi:predicted nucleic acid-binding protein
MATGALVLPTLYIETTVVSYLAGRPSRDTLVLAHQEVTRQWWDTSRAGYALFVSPLVIEESGRGDPDVAKRRLSLLNGVEVLDGNSQAQELAGRIETLLQLPARARADAVHLAFAVHYELDYLLTWNCAHLANARNLRLLADFARSEGVWLPVICTPDEMVEEPEAG